MRKFSIGKCPKCGGMVNLVSGLHRCTHCHHTLFQGGPAWSSRYLSPDFDKRYEDNYTKWKGEFAKVVGREPDLTKMIGSKK